MGKLETIPKGAEDIHVRMETVKVYTWKCPLIAAPTKAMMHPRGKCKYKARGYNVEWVLYRKKTHIDKHTNAKAKIQKLEALLKPEVNA